MKKLLQAFLIPIFMILGYTLMIMGLAAAVAFVIWLVRANLDEPSFLIWGMDFIVIATVIAAIRSKSFRKGCQEFWKQIKWNK